MVLDLEEQEVQTWAKKYSAECMWVAEVLLGKACSEGRGQGLD